MVYEKEDLGNYRYLSSFNIAGHTKREGGGWSMFVPTVLIFEEWSLAVAKVRRDLCKKGAR